MDDRGDWKSTNWLAHGPRFADDKANAFLMAAEIFQSSRWTRGNFLFPTRIEVTPTAVVRRKRSWFSVDEISISIYKVASVRIQTGLVWSEIRIESSGGSDPLMSHGHTKSDARRIKELVEQYQALPENRANMRPE